MVRAATLKVRAKAGAKGAGGLPWEEEPTATDAAADGAGAAKGAGTEPVPCKGIVNLGNTCFFNSVLQNLVRTNEFRRCVLDGVDLHGDPLFGPQPRQGAGDEGDKGDKGDDESGDGGDGGDGDGEVETGPMTDVLGTFFEEMCTVSGKKKSVGNVRPTELFGELIRQSPRYKGFQQHDAHELLWTLLDILRVEERKRLKALGVTDKPEAAGSSSVAAPEASGGGGGDDAAAAKPRRAKPPDTYIEKIFGGQFRSGIKCKRCGHESVMYEPFCDLQIPIREAAAPVAAGVPAAAEEELSKREKKKQQAAMRVEKQRQKQEGKKEAKSKGAPSTGAGEGEAEEGRAGSDEEDGGGGKGKKGKRKPMSKHEKKLEVARIKAEKIAAARMKRRTKQFDEFYKQGASSEEEDSDAMPSRKQVHASPGGGVARGAGGGEEEEEEEEEGAGETESAAETDEETAGGPDAQGDDLDAAGAGGEYRIVWNV